MVTGGHGFLGSHVVRSLRAHGYGQVFAPGSHEYDLREQRQVRQLLSDLKPQLIIHLAAVVGGIAANRDNPGRFFYENLIMGAMLMEESRSRAAEKFVTVGTICSYPKLAPIPFREDDLWNGYPEETNAAYGIAKKALLVQSQSYRQQYGFRAIYLMPVNLYGPDDNFDLDRSHVIPALIRKCVEARESGASELIVWGDGSPTREFLFVDDAARGIVLAARHYDAPDPVNLGCGHEISIKELVTMIARLTGFAGKIVWDTAMPNGQPRRRLDVGRARAAFGFEAQVPLEDGLKQTVEWFLAQRQKLVRKCAKTEQA